METTLSLTNLSDLYDDYKSDPIAKKIKESIEKYKSLGMAKMVKSAQEGAASFVLSKFNMNLMHVTAPNLDGDMCLNLIDFEGGRSRIGTGRDGGWWKKCLLEDYDKPIPFDILKKLPSDWGKNSEVFYPSWVAKDPIIAVPIGQPAGKHKLLYEYESKNLFRKPKIKQKYKKKNSDGLYAAVFRWD